MIRHCSWLVLRARFVPAKGLFKDLSAWQTRWASRPEFRSLTNDDSNLALYRMWITDRTNSRVKIDNKVDSYL